MDFNVIIEAHEQAVTGLKDNCLTELEKIAEICRQAFMKGHQIIR